jgi:hypothetical protein
MLIAQIGGIRKSVQTAKLGKQSSPRQAVASMLRVGSLQQFKNHMVRQADLDPARSCHLGKFLSYFRDRSARRRIVHGRVVGRVEVYSNRAHSVPLSFRWAARHSVIRRALHGAGPHVVQEMACQPHHLNGHRRPRVGMLPPKSPWSNILRGCGRPKPPRGASPLLASNLRSARLCRLLQRAECCSVAERHLQHPPHIADR